MRAQTTAYDRIAFYCCIITLSFKRGHSLLFLRHLVHIRLQSKFFYLVCTLQPHLHPPLYPLHHHHTLFHPLNLPSPQDAEERPWFVHPIQCLHLLIILTDQGLHRAFETDKYRQKDVRGHKLHVHKTSVKQKQGLTQLLLTIIVRKGIPGMNTSLLNFSRLKVKTSG